MSFFLELAKRLGTKVETLINKKTEKLFSLYHLLHIAIVWVFAIVFSMDPGFWIAASLIAVFHLLTDVMKSWLMRNRPLKNHFFTDQFIHLSVIVLVVIAYNHYAGINLIYDIKPHTAAVITAFVLNAKPGNIIIKNLFDVFSIKVPPGNTGKHSEGLPNAGKIIGIVERYVALALIIMSQYAAVGLIVAAKSILRFQDPIKNEYVLIGTLLSFGIAIISGILIHAI